MTINRDGYRVGQRLCQVQWQRGVPHLAVKAISSVGKCSIKIDGESASTHLWHENWKDAMEQAYLHRMWGHDVLHRMKNEDPPIGKTVTAICRLRRLEKRLGRRGVPEQLRQLSRKERVMNSLNRVEESIKNSESPIEVAE